MATVATSSQSDLLSWPTVPAIARDISAGGLKDYMYVVVRTAADTLTVYRSTNEGASWASFSSFTHTGVQEWSSPVVDRSAWLHLAYRSGTGSEDAIWYKRLNLNTGVWSTALRTSAADANGGTIGSRWTGVDLAVVYNSNGTYSIAVCGAFANGTSNYGLLIMGVTIDGSRNITVNNGIITGNRYFYDNGAPPGRSGVACEVEHNGDGYTSSTPHLWVAWGRTALRMVKLAWQGSSWAGPGSYVTVRSSMGAHDFVGGRWDGAQWVMAIVSPDDSTVVRLYQRNQANTVTSSFDTPTHPTGVVRAMASSYDASNRNVRVFAVGTSTSVLYYVDYNRATSTWGSWTAVTGTAIGPSFTEWSVRRGGSADNARIDVVTSASGSPNTVTHTGMATITAPSVATWTNPAGRYNGGPADVAAALLLSWTFSDSDPGQTQGYYALSRQIGAGTVQYWRASDSTWQAAEVQNASTVTQVTLPSGWGLDADGAHTYKVKVWDSGGLPASGHSDPYTVIPSALANPTVTAPTAGSTLATDRVTVTWTVAQQTSYRITLSTGGVLTADTGWVAGTATSYTMPTVLPNGSSWSLTLQTANSEGLLSAVQTVAFSVQYAQPPVPYSTITPVPASGYIQVVGSAAAAVGAQPAIDSVSLYRRPTVATINANPSMAGNVTGWAVGGGSSGTLTYSTSQSVAYSTPGAARFVPGGGSTSPTVESTAVTIDPAKIYVGSGWIRPDTANKPITVSVNWYTSGNVYISSATTTITPPIAGVWHYLEVLAYPGLVAGAAKASVAIGETSTPVAVDAFYADEIRLREYTATLNVVRIATNLTVPATVNDWGAASNTDYEYRWLAVGNNGTSISGPWQS